MLDEHKVVNKIKVSVFIKKVKEYGYDNIEATDHAFFRISSKQRKIYTEEKLKDIVFNQKPIEASIQKNNNYAALYIYLKERFLKVLLDFTIKKIYIVSFYILNKEQERNIRK